MLGGVTVPKQETAVVEEIWDEYSYLSMYLHLMQPNFHTRVTDGPSDYILVNSDSRVNISSLRGAHIRSFLKAELI